MEGGICSSGVFPLLFFRNLFFQICSSGAIRLKKCTYITNIFIFCPFFATSVKRFAQKSKRSCNCQKENTESGDLGSDFKVVNRSCVICTKVYAPKKCFRWYRFGSTFKSVSHLYSWTDLLYKKCLIRQWLQLLLSVYMLISMHCEGLFPKMFFRALSFEFGLNVVCKFCRVSLTSNKINYCLSASFIDATSFLSYFDTWIGGRGRRKISKSNLGEERLKNVLPFLYCSTSVLFG